MNWQRAAAFAGRFLLQERVFRFPSLMVALGVAIVLLSVLTWQDARTFFALGVAAAGLAYASAGTSDLTTNIRAIRTLRLLALFSFVAALLSFAVVLTTTYV